MRIFGVSITFIDRSDNEEWRGYVPTRLVELGMGEEVYQEYAEEYGEEDEGTQAVKELIEQHESRSLFSRLFG